MKKLLVMICAFAYCGGAYAQSDSLKSVVITAKEVVEFENDINQSGYFIQSSGLTQILGLASAGAGIGLTLAYLKNPKESYRIGSIVCFGFSGVFTITSAGLKWAGGGRLKNTLLKRNPIIK